MGGQPTTPPPLAINYASSVAPSDRTSICREGDELVVRIAGPRAWRMILLNLLQTLLFCVVAGIAALFCLGIASAHSSESDLPIVIGGGLLVLITWQFASLLVRSVRLLRRPNISTEVRVSRSELLVKSSAAPRAVPRQWRSAEIVDLTTCEAGALPVLARYVRLEIVLTDDLVGIVKIPWRGGEPLAYIEDNLRDAIGLKPR